MMLLEYLILVSLTFYISLNLSYLDNSEFVIKFLMKITLTWTLQTYQTWQICHVCSFQKKNGKLSSSWSGSKVVFLPISSKASLPLLCSGSTGKYRSFPVDVFYCIVPDKSLSSNGHMPQSLLHSPIALILYHITTLTTNVK